MPLAIPSREEMATDKDKLRNSEIEASLKRNPYIGYGPPSSPADFDREVEKQPYASEQEELWRTDKLRKFFGY